MGQERTTRQGGRESGGEHARETRPGTTIETVMASPLLRGLTACVTLVSLGVPALEGASPGAFEPLDFDRGAAGLGLSLRRVGRTARVLYVTAHPDDEHNGVLVRLSRGLGLRTALLTVTRGEGGQNAIGSELFDALGVLRTGELLALHRYDGVEQYFGRAYEFGYSFSVEETLEKWGREETLGDIVRVVRTFHPDVVLALPLQGRGGGQHHQAAAQLAREAFRAAADPARFPEQGLPAWQARKLYEGGIGGFGGPEDTAVRVPTNEYDPLIGMTWQQLGTRARAMHRCQGMSQIGSDLGPAVGLFRLVAADPAVTHPEADFLDGVDTTLSGLRRFAPESELLATSLATLQGRLAEAREAFDPLSPEAAVPALTSALTHTRALRTGLGALVASAPGRAEIDGRLADEEADVEAALVLAHGLVLEAHADDGLVTPGQSLRVSVALFNHSRRALQLEALELTAPAGWTVERLQGGEAGALAGGDSRRARFRLRVASDAPPSQPYWRKLPDRDRHQVLVPADETLPWSPPPAVARARLRIADVATSVSAPAVWRYDGPFVGGERRHALTVVPDLSLRVTPEVAAVPLSAPRGVVEVRVSVRNYGKSRTPAAVRLEAPEGFRVEPAGVTLPFSVEDEEAVARFQVRPPAGLAPGLLTLRAVATRDGREHRHYVQPVDYDHVERRQLVRLAEARLVVLDVRSSPDASVGYVMGSGDGVADAIRELGVPLALLSGDDLLFSDLGRFTTIVCGIRAYETRPDLRAAHARLMRWVEGGGHLVVQYNRAAFNRLAPEAPPLPAEAPSPHVPLPAAVTSERISDESAPVRVLAPGHPLLAAPNRIGAADWEGWVQERGIQLLATRDPGYTDVLASTDPFPYNPGEKRGLLVDAKVGEGTWTYVGLALFRQVPAGVPGGWRLLANLVSRPRGQVAK
jgi:LmbE family N-acetylglucosaminyl deacetylase